MLFGATAPPLSTTSTSLATAALLQDMIQEMKYENIVSPNLIDA